MERSNTTAPREGGVHRPFDKTMREWANETFEVAMWNAFVNNFVQTTSTNDNIEKAKSAFAAAVHQIINTGYGDDQSFAIQIFNDTIDNVLCERNDFFSTLTFAFKETISKLSLNKIYTDKYRRTLTNRLNQLPYFKALFSSDSVNSKDYRFPENPNTPSSLYTLRLHWETFPLIRAYCQTETKEYKNKCKDLDNKKKAMLLDKYRDSLSYESGKYFSLFRNTDPLYQHLILKKLVLDLLPERIVLLLVTLLLSTASESAGLLMGTIKALDTLIDQNISAIDSLSETPENIEEIVSSAFDFLDLETSVKALYERLEKDRKHKPERKNIVYKGNPQKTFGIPTYNQINAKATDKLEIIFTYLNNYDKGNPIQKKVAEKAYDEYRRANQNEGIIRESKDFEDAIKAVMDISTRGNFFRTKDMENPLGTERLIYTIIIDILANDASFSDYLTPKFTASHHNFILLEDPLLYNYCQQCAEDIKNQSSTYRISPATLLYFVFDKAHICSKKILMKWRNILPYKNELKNKFVNKVIQEDVASPEVTTRQAISEIYMQIFKDYIKIPVHPATKQDNSSPV